jgi:hypothetical protein
MKLALLGIFLLIQISALRAVDEIEIVGLDDFQSNITYASIAVQRLTNSIFKQLKFTQADVNPILLKFQDRSTSSNLPPKKLENTPSVFF